MSNKLIKCIPLCPLMPAIWLHRLLNLLYHRTRTRSSNQPANCSRKCILFCSFAHQEFLNIIVKLIKSGFTNFVYTLKTNANLVTNWPHGFFESLFYHLGDAGSTCSATNTTLANSWYSIIIKQSVNVIHVVLSRAASIFHETWTPARRSIHLLPDCIIKCESVHFSMKPIVDFCTSWIVSHNI